MLASLAYEADAIALSLPKTWGRSAAVNPAASHLAQLPHQKASWTDQRATETHQKASLAGVLDPVDPAQWYIAYAATGHQLMVAPELVAVAPPPTVSRQGPAFALASAPHRSSAHMAGNQHCLYKQHTTLQLEHDLPGWLWMSTLAYCGSTACQRKT